MDNLTKYQEVFKKIFGAEVRELEDLQYQSIEAWDSVGHMEMIAEIEDVFGIMMSSEDMMDILSYQKGIEILKKYDIEM